MVTDFTGLRFELVLVTLKVLEIRDAQFRVRVLPGSFKFLLRGGGSFTLLLRLQTFHQSKQRTPAVFVSFQIVAKDSFGVDVVSAPQQIAAEQFAHRMKPLWRFIIGQRVFVSDSFKEK